MGTKLIKIYLPTIIPSFFPANCPIIPCSETTGSPDRIIKQEDKTRGDSIVAMLPPLPYRSPRPYQGMS